MKTPQELYYDLSYFTLSLDDSEFIHQHIVDAFTAQQATEKTKPITITFALAGLYLYLEKNFTGKEVQNAHIQMAKKRKHWPTFDLPKVRGEITVSDVLDVPITERKIMIRTWCDSVWNAYKDNHEKIKNIIESALYN